MIRALALAASLALLAAPARAELAPDQAAQIVSQALAEAITARDAEAAAVLCATPVNLDGAVASRQEEVLERWRSALSRDELLGLRLQRVELLTLAEMIAREGSPPTRLGPLPTDALVAILSFDRAQLVAVLALRDGRWAIIAVTD